MRHLSAAITVLVFTLLFGCASIFNGFGPQEVQILSTPLGAKCDVRSAGTTTVIASITTPSSVILKKKAGYFRPANYIVQCVLESKEPREALVSGRISGWYFGNIAIGGALGMALIDPATGGMWTLSPKTVVINYSDVQNALPRGDSKEAEQDVSEQTKTIK